MFLRKRAKGFTLYELTIVIALMAIIVALVVSFVTYLSNYKDKAQDYSGASDEIYAYKVFMERWFSRFDTEGCEFSCTDESTSLTATVDSTDTYKVYLKDEKIYFQYEYNGDYGTPDSSGDYNVLYLTAEYITSLAFKKYSETSDQFIRCTVGCNSGDVTFLLERHVG